MISQSIADRSHTPLPPSPHFSPAHSLLVDDGYYPIFEAGVFSDYQPGIAANDPGSRLVPNRAPGDLATMIATCQVAVDADIAIRRDLKQARAATKRHEVPRNPLLRSRFRKESGNPFY